MRLEAIQPRRAWLVERLEPQWRAPLLQLALAWSALLALFAGDWAAMAMLWWNSSTYNHVLLVPAIMGWLVWQRAGDLSRLGPQAWWPGLALLAGALFVWLLGEISGTATLNHLGLVVAAQACVVTVLGPRVAWALAFPLAYGLFLVPVGDELVPALQMITARITIVMIELSGIPAVIDGVFIDTPAGLFEVAEACSGVKFLIAMVALGALVAHVGYRSWRRRALFMLVAIVLPVLANGVRAWGTIMIAQSQGVGFAAGFDHIFYGWIFFALVMAALLALGWRFFDRSAEHGFVDSAAMARASWLVRLERWSGTGWLILAGLLAMMLTGLAWAHRAQRQEAELPAQIELPAIPGWTRIAATPAHPWQPRMGGADHWLIGSYADSRGSVVEVAYALYAAQHEGREAGAYGEGALPPDSDWRWLASSSPVPEGGQGDRLQALGQHQRLAWTWYRHGDWAGASRTRLKLANIADSLTLDPEPTMMLILSAEETAGQDAGAALANFREAIGPVPQWMDAVGAVD